MVQCTSRVLLVVNMMIYPLDYCESLLLFLVRISGWCCNQTIHRYVGMLKGGDGVLNVGVDLGLLLLDGAFCPTAKVELFIYTT